MYARYIRKMGIFFALQNFFKDDDVLLADTPDTALIQVLRHLSPVTVVDESHNAGSDLRRRNAEQPKSVHCFRFDCDTA